MVPVWPSINYYAELGSWNFIRSDGKSRASSDMDNGGSRNRRRFTRTFGSYTCNIILSDLEFAVWSRFYDDELADGTKWFMMPVFDGVSYRNYLVRYPVDFIPTASGSAFRQVSLTVQLQIYDVYEIDAATYYILSRYGIKAASNMFNALHNFVYTVWPTITKG